MLAKAIARESGAAFINVRVANLQSKWFGDANKLVTAVFTLAWKGWPGLRLIIYRMRLRSFLLTLSYCLCSSTGNYFY